ncbi:hypothetical protein DPMN_029927 [Dreissena polymorpha]|uniref:Uncharacterized protein n=1 Tax=Dreissena polymorpha TaxID=45954 RepID=A0A9D4RFW9_DREPO|nr:hypothetical protein DPMN_029927 [Dreissena polymorpha]
MHTTIASGKVRRRMQNLSLPHYSRQIGPLYFLTLRKIKIFGVRLNFLIDEDQTIGMDGKTSHHPDAYFRFDQSKPGIVTAKIQHDGEEKELQILKNLTFLFQNVERPHSCRPPAILAPIPSKDYFFGN